MNARFLFFALFFSALCCSNAQGMDDTLRERRDILSGWIVDAEKAFSESPNPEVEGLLSFLRDYGVISAPFRSSFRPLEPSSGGEKSFAVIVVTEEDSEVGPFWKELIEGGHVLIGYWPHDRALVVSEEEGISSKMKGLLLLQELFYAKKNVENPIDSQDFRAYCAREVSTAEFRGRLLAALGGDLYAKIIKGEEDRILRELTAKNGRIFQDIVEAGDYDSRLDDVYGGEPLSDAEAASRVDQIWQQAYFNLIDRDPLVIDKGEQKAKFMAFVLARSNF